tara:strand:+ start:1280 stop:1621 length:342 start_codon:yes stop_codon:yes gene_type:complete
MANNNFFSIDVVVDQTQNNLKAQASLQSRDVIGVRYIYTSDIVEELSKQGWSVGDCLSVGKLDNITNNNLAGEWVFTLGPPRTTSVPDNVEPSLEEKAKAVPRRRRTKTKNKS